MKRKSVLFLLIIYMIIMSGCCISHQWIDADCTHPKTCVKCSKTDGIPTGHLWIDANYTTPKTCAYCGLTEGEPLPLPYSTVDLTRYSTQDLSVKDKPEASALTIGFVDKNDSVHVIGISNEDDYKNYVKISYTLPDGSSVEGYLKSAFLSEINPADTIADNNNTSSGSTFTSSDGQFQLYTNIIDLSQYKPATGPYSPGFYTDQAEYLFELINNERSAQGLTALTWDPVLAQCANQRAQELTELFSHNRPDGTLGPSWAAISLSDNYGQRYFRVYENIHRTANYKKNDSTEICVASWMASSLGHREAVLYSNEDYGACGCWCDGYTFYYCYFVR